MRARSPGVSEPSLRILAMERLRPASRPFETRRLARGQGAARDSAARCAAAGVPGGCRCVRLRPAPRTPARGPRRIRRRMRNSIFYSCILPPELSTIAMASGLQRERPKAGGVLVTVAAGVLLLLRALPLMRAYGRQALRPASAVRASPRPRWPAWPCVLLAWLGIRRRPRATALAFAAVALAMVVLSGNLPAAARRGRDPRRRLSSSATRPSGCSPARRPARATSTRSSPRAPSRRGRSCCCSARRGCPAPRLSRSSRCSSCFCAGAAYRPSGISRAGPFVFLEATRPPALEAAWLALAALFLLATWAGVLAPDLSWDALAYHLPEARDIAASGRVRPLPDLEPQSLLWRGHDAYLALGFLFGGGQGGKSGPVPPVRDGPLRLRRRARSRAPAQSRRSVGSDRPGARGVSRPRCCSSARRTWTGPRRSSSRRRPRSSRSGRRAPGVSASPAFSSAARSRSRSSRSSPLRRFSCSRCVRPGPAAP